MKMIEKQRVLETIANVDNYGDGVAYEALGHAYRDVALIPTVEVPVKYGKWITKSTGGEYFDCCSECGYVEWSNPNKYCPNCGAFMRGEDG